MMKSFVISYAVFAVIIHVCMAAISNNDATTFISSKSDYLISNEDKKTGRDGEEKCGDDLTWTLENGLLTISGSGRMYDFDDSSKTPWYNSAIETIVIKEGVTSIGRYAFSDTSFTTINISSSVVSVGYRPFWGCQKSTSINVAANNPKYESIDGVLFDKESNTLVKYPQAKTDTIYSIPEGVTSTGQESFRSNSYLKYVSFSSTVNIIGDGSFFGTGLTRVVLPSVTKINDQNAFYYCTSLKSVTISASMKSIGKNAFGATDSIQTVFFLGTTPPSCADNAFRSSLTPKICVPPDYSSPKFCGKSITPDDETCKPFLKLFNHCFEGAIEADEVISKKRTNATEKENERINDCYEYFCDNESGTQMRMKEEAIAWENQTLNKCYEYFCDNSSGIQVKMKEDFERMDRTINECYEYFCDNETGTQIRMKEEAAKLVNQAINECYEYFCDNSSGIQIRMKKEVTEWENRTNECFEYTCENESGIVGKTVCNSIDTVIRSCVDGKCIENKAQNDGDKWKVVIDMNETKAVDIDTMEVINSIVSASGTTDVLDVDQLLSTMEIQIDENGYATCVVFYLIDEESAKMVSDTVERIVASCSMEL